MPEIKKGLKAHIEITVGRQHLSSVTGNLGVQVLPTHHVVLLMELAARNAIKHLLPAGRITVGTCVEIRHLAAAPPGSRVCVEGCLERIDGPFLGFHVSAHDSFDELAEAYNEQRIVNLKAFVNRLKKSLRCKAE